jgi:ADP-heptose:LPS heptosyltransferase
MTVAPTSSLKFRVVASLRRWNSRLQIAPHTGRLDELLPLRSPARIVIFVAAGIGDFVLATSLLKVIYDRLGEIDVTLLCNSLTSNFAQAIFPRWEILTVPYTARGRRMALWPWRSPMRRFLERLPEADLLIDLRGLRTVQDSVAASWVPARWKIAMMNQYGVSPYRLGDERSIYDELIPFSETPLAPGVCRDIENHRLILERLIPSDPDLHKALPSLPSWTPSLEHVWARSQEYERYLVICPFSGESIKEYPMEDLADVAGRVARRHGLIPCIMGGPDCIERSQTLESHLKRFGECRNLTGQLPLCESAWVLEHCRAVLAVDTGLAHIAIAYQTPTAAILGGGHFGHFAPWGDPRSTRWLYRELPCYGCHWFCPYPVPKCIHSVLKVDIEDALEQVLLDRR